MTAILCWLTLGITAVLSLASVVGALLKYRVARRLPHPVIDNLNSRIKSWWLMVLVLAGSIWLGRTAIILLFLCISLQSLREYVSITYSRRGDHRALVWSFFFFLPLQYYLIAIQWYGLFAIFIPVYAFLLLPVSMVVSGDSTRFLERAAKMQWGLMICVYCLSYVPALLTLDIAGYQGRDALLLVFLLFTVQVGDVLQYIWGKLAGRRPLAPGISPGKTVEGLLGGVLSATAAGTTLWWLTPFHPWQACLIALVINGVGVCGGLVLSAIKRDHGVKDWGTFLEGHGGMLDRVDSLSFAAPIFFHIVRYWWVA